MHYLLFYELVPNYLELREEYRAEHLDLARAAQTRGELVLGGAFAEPADGAALLFRGDTPEVVESFAEADPYVRHGLVTSWQIRRWTTVVGDWAEHPIP